MRDYQTALKQIISKVEKKPLKSGSSHIFTILDEGSSSYLVHLNRNDTDETQFQR